MALAPNTRLGRYEIRSKLGEGGMGEVYLAEDKQLNRKVAIKCLPPGSIASEQANRRLLREARAAANLDHPNICAIHEVGEEEGRSFIVMQYLEGETLDTRMKRKSLDLPESLTIAIQVTDALAEAHGHGIIHRDIKPSNIMITGRGAVKVMDFGLAKITQEGFAVDKEAETQSLLSTPGAVMGTVPYMSPEQVRGEQLDARTDIFSFGVVLYEMITGRQPFVAESSAGTISAIMTHEPPPLARYSREAPAELERIVSKALRKNKEERYQTAKDLLIDLRSLSDELQFEARLERSTPPDVSRDQTVVMSGAQAMVETDHQPVVRTSSEDEKSTREGIRGNIATALGGPLLSRIALVVIIAVFALAVAGWFYWRSANAKWAKEQVPRIEQLAQAQKYFEAYDLAAATQKYLPDEATITRLMPTISDTLTVTTEPTGAEVYLKRFSPDDSGQFP
ncbi:MAG: serine/threonine protein kinase, partial [Acidobacteria bacterium]|nr:serine/threonine protein kinase [Acidobacteriota bacterium]